MGKNTKKCWIQNLLWSDLFIIGIALMIHLLI
ncbi:MAG: hypothetical protein ACI9VT_003095 [Psychroserpens sp.]|jgi:hypothetical protein